MIIRVSGFDSPIAASSSARVDFTWPKAGLVKAFWLNDVDGLAVSRAWLGLAIQRRGREVVAADRGRAFASGVSSCGPGDVTLDWCDLLFPVDPFEVWFLEIANADPLNPHTPVLCFDFTPVGPVERVYA